MNIFRKICACVFVLSMLSLSACAGSNTSENTGYYDNSAYINVNVAASNVLCFDMVFFTKEKVNSVEYISLAGEGGADSFRVSVINNTIDIYSDHVYKGLYCSDFMFECTPDKQNADYTIDGIELKINGEAKKFKFRNPIKYNSGEGNNIFDDKLQVYQFPCEFPSAFINSGEYAKYDFIANEKIKLEEIYVGGGLEADVKLIQNGMEKECEFPLEVEAGAELSLNIGYKSEILNEFNYVLTNLYFTYECGGQKYTSKGVIVFSPTSPVDPELKTIDSYIDFITSQ